MVACKFIIPPANFALSNFDNTKFDVSTLNSIRLNSITCSQIRLHQILCRAPMLITLNIKLRQTKFYPVFPNSFAPNPMPCTNFDNAKFDAAKSVTAHTKLQIQQLQILVPSTAGLCLKGQPRSTRNEFPIRADFGNSRKHPIWRLKRGENWQPKEPFYLQRSVI